MLCVHFVFLAFASAGCEETLKPIAAALQQHKPAEAAALLNALRLQCAGSASFHELAGIASVMGGNFTGGADELEQAFSINPRLSGEPTLFLWYAQALLETKQAPRLATFLAHKQGILSPPLLFSLGTLFAKNGDYQRAIKYFRQIPAETADDAVYFNVALAYSHLRQFEDARRFYFQAIDRNPANVEAYFRVGLDFAASGDTRKAIPWLFRARKFAPARPDISYALAEQLLLLKYFDTAQEVVTDALTKNPLDPLLMVAKGDVLLAQGTQPEAVASFQGALAIAPKSAAALLGLARVDLSKGKTEEARRQLEAALSIEPENPAANGELGSLETEDDDWSGAYSHLSKAWSADQSNPTLAVRLARTLQHLNRTTDALHLLQPLTPRLDNLPAFHFELAQIYTRLGKTVEAQSERQQLATLQAKSENTLHFEEPKTYAH